ncbi:MAG TPA: hypothetical protein VI462_08405 [Acidimicrobiia bacterium]
MNRVPIDRDAAESLSTQWWVLLFSGALAVVVGVVILSIQWTVGDLATVAAIFLIVNGGLRMLTPAMDNTGRGWTLAVGGVEVLVGVAFVAWPSVSLLTLAIFIGHPVHQHADPGPRQDRPGCWSTACSTSPEGSRAVTTSSSGGSTSSPA